MEELALQFFPFPHVFRGSRRPGLLVEWAPACRSCDRQCEAAEASTIELCSYGVNYRRVDGDLLIAGVVVHDYPTMTTARRKALRTAQRDVVAAADVERVAKRALESTAEEEGRLQARREDVIAEYRTTKQYQRDIVDLMRPDLQRALGQVHDYKQFVQQVIQNMNVILETKYEGAALEEKLDKATHEEAAIYWAAKLMEEKLDAALYLLFPERIGDLKDRRRFRFHGMVTKYSKIYQRRLESKGLTLRSEGQSFGDVEENPRALAIIPHTLIDNAIKYAPSLTTVTMRFAETDDTIGFEVESYGPVILPDERDHLFDLFFRGRMAAAMEAEGTGFGLAAAQNVATAIGVEIAVSQSGEPGPAGTRQTRFGFEVRRAMEREAPQRASQRGRRPGGGRR